MNQSVGQRTAANVRAELARRKISGRELAHGLKWSTPTTWRRLNGTHPFDIDELAAVARFLDVPISRLVDDTEEELLPSPATA